MPVLARAAWPILFAALGVYAAHVLLDIGGTTFNVTLYTVLMAAAAGGCLVRAARVRDERLAWTTMGIGLLLFTVADLYWSVALADLEEPPYPSLSDIGWIAWYPFAGGALFLLVRGRFPQTGRTQWLDGTIAGLGCAAFGTALFAGRLMASSLGDSLPATLTNLAYPVGDLVLLAVCVWGLAVSGWRPGLSWLLICAGVLVGAIADFWYLWGVLHDSYQEGSAVDILWPLSTLLIARAAWQPYVPRRAANSGRRVLAVSAIVSLSAVALLVVDHFQRLHAAAIWLAAGTLVAVVARTWLTFSDYVTLLERTSHDALTDPLTGLANRRRLVAELDDAVMDAAAEPRALVMLDLNGFKGFNDNFGHAAGDALLIRIAARLTAAVDGAGRAYRMGGDEFCVIVPTDPRELDATLEALRAASSESAHGVAVTAAAGAVLVPDEARTADAALRLADARMYRNKQTNDDGRGSYALA